MWLFRYCFPRRKHINPMSQWECDALKMKIRWRLKYYDWRCKLPDRTNRRYKLHTYRNLRNGELVWR